MIDNPSYLSPHRLHVLDSSIFIWKEFSHHAQRFFYTFVSSKHGKLGPRISKHYLHTLTIRKKSTFLGSWSILYHYISTMPPPFQCTKNFLALIRLELLEIIQSHRLIFGLISSLVPLCKSSNWQSLGGSYHVLDRVLVVPFPTYFLTYTFIIFL